MIYSYNVDDAKRMLLQNDIGIVVENVVANDNVSASGDTITRETGEMNELTSKEHSQDYKKHAEKTSPLEDEYTI